MTGDGLPPAVPAVWDNLRLPLLAGLAAAFSAGFTFYGPIARYIMDITDFIDKVYFGAGVMGAIVGLLFAISLRLLFPDFAPGSMALVVLACSVGMGIYAEGLSRDTFRYDPNLAFAIRMGDSATTPYIIAASIVMGTGIAFACSGYNPLIGYDGFTLSERRVLRVAVLASAIPFVMTYYLLEVGVLDVIVRMMPTPYNFYMVVAGGCYALFMGPIVAWYLQAQMAEDAAAAAASVEN